MPDNENNSVESKRPEKEKENKQDQYLWLGFPTIFLIWFLYGYCQGSLQADTSFDRLNALFSGLAFWGVIWAILLQKRELRYQRDELILTRGEVRGQKEQLQAQNVTLSRQRFENTFFSLLNLFINVINSMEVTANIGGKITTFSGRECFTVLYNGPKYPNIRLRCIVYCCLSEIC